MKKTKSIEKIRLEKKERLKSALEYYKENNINNDLSIRFVAKKFNVNRVTLTNRINGKSFYINAGHPTIFSEEEEKMLVEWIFKMSDVGYSVDRNGILEKAQLMINIIRKKRNSMD